MTRVPCRSRRHFVSDRRMRARCALTLLLLALGRAAEAQEQSERLIGFHHERWGMEDGLPA
jgi:hypothetical protein